MSNAPRDVPPTSDELPQNSNDSASLESLAQDWLVNHVTGYGDASIENVQSLAMLLQRVQTEERARIIRRQRTETARAVEDGPSLAGVMRRESPRASFDGLQLEHADGTVKVFIGMTKERWALFDKWEREQRPEPPQTGEGNGETGSMGAVRPMAGVQRLQIDRRGDRSGVEVAGGVRLREPTEASGREGEDRSASREELRRVATDNSGPASLNYEMACDYCRALAGPRNCSCPRSTQDGSVDEERRIEERLVVTDLCDLIGTADTTGLGFFPRAVAILKRTVNFIERQDVFDVDPRIARDQHGEKK